MDTKSKFVWCFERYMVFIFGDITQKLLVKIQIQIPYIFILAFGNLQKNQLYLSHYCVTYDSSQLLLEVNQTCFKFNEVTQAKLL